MGTHLDPLDEIFPERAANNARAGVKFQPKAKPHCRKESSAIPSKQFVEVVDNAENKFGALVGRSLASSETLETERCLKTNEDSVAGSHPSDDAAALNPSLEHVQTGETLGRSVDLHFDVVLPDSNGVWHTTGKLTGESGDIFFGLESLDDFYSQSTTATVDATSRSPEKVDLSVHLGNEFSSSCPVTDDAEGFVVPSEIPSVHVSDTRIAEEGPLIPVVSPLDDSTVGISNASTSYPLPEATISQDSLLFGEAVVSNSDEGFHINNRSLQIEEAEAVPCLETLDDMYEFTTRSGQRRGKFQPKPKAQIDREKPGGCTSRPDGNESVPFSQDAQSFPSESEYINEGSIPEFPPNDLLDSASLRFDDTASKIPENEERVNVAETSGSDAFVPGEQPLAVPEILEKVSPSAKRRRSKPPKVPDDSSEHQQASISGQEKETGRSMRQLRKRVNVCELVDEDEADDDENFTYDPSGSHIDEDEINDGEIQQFNETQNTKEPRRSTKSAPQKEKRVRKRKKSNEVPDQATKEPRKKFSHSTRRKRRQVDKVLLETPEDEIDMRKLSLRDIILLAEHRERIARKEAKTTEVPSTNHSGGTSFVNFNENDETFASGEGGFSDDQTNPIVQESSNYTNYQTYMNKTPRSRWSKRDTELFYKAVRQFGSDISMIQQLFPGRTRAQVKLKYKKEERQNPFMLHEALTTRAKDLSHFQMVIERLKEIAAEEKENSCRDDSIALTDNEEVNPETNEEEVAKPEQADEGEVEATEPHVAEVQSPAKSCDSEDELTRWSQYKSEL